MSRSATNASTGTVLEEPERGAPLTPASEALGLHLVRLISQQDVAERQLTAGPEQLKAWVEEPLQELEPLLLDDRAVLGLRHVRRRLHRELAGRTLWVAPYASVAETERWGGERAAVRCIHPESPGPQAAVSRDWPIEVDRIHLFFASRSARHDGSDDVAQTAVELLTNGWSAEDRELIGTDWSPNPVRPSSLVLLAWLQQGSGSCVKRATVPARRARREQLNAFWSASPPTAPYTKRNRTATVPRAAK